MADLRELYQTMILDHAKQPRNFRVPEGANRAAAGHNLGVQVRVEEHGNGTSNIPVIKQILDYANNPHLAMIWNCSASDCEEMVSTPAASSSLRQRRYTESRLVVSSETCSGVCLRLFTRFTRSNATAK